MARILHKGSDEDGFLRTEAEIEILTPIAFLAAQMVILEQAGRVCYRSQRGEITYESARDFIGKIMKRGHESVIEHSIITVEFSNVSRGFTHEMVRHRLCAISQESTRYCDYADSELDLEKAELTFIMPPHREKNTVALHLPGDVDVEGAMRVYENAYKNLRNAGWIPQDARQFLPIGIASKIVVTANFREWRHIMKMRTQRAAHWEIRSVMCDLLAVLKRSLPIIFSDFELSEKPDAQGYRYAIHESVDYNKGYEHGYNHVMGMGEENL